jgi:hypothetical protein
MTEIEMLNLSGAMQAELSEKYECKIVRVGMGHIMTSLDMAGANFSILKVSPYLVSLIDDTWEFPGWPKLTVPGGKLIASSLYQNNESDLENKVNLQHKSLKTKPS